MAPGEVTPTAATGKPLLPAFPVLLAGLGAVAAAWLLAAAAPGGALATRAALIVVGLIATGGALALRLPHAGSTTESRLAAAGLWLLGAFSLLVARLALAPAWDSVGLLLGVLMGVAVVGAVLTALPGGWRMLAVSLLIVFHLGGICVAIVNVPSPGGPPPWLASQAWSRVYRPYLTFTNLDNGYHFYSPEPGPCALLWFRVEFADGSSRWRRIPDHDSCRNHLDRRRFGSLAAAVGQTVPVAPQRGEQLAYRRLEAGRAHEPPIPPGDIPLPAQYREPTAHAKMLLASYARYVARTTRRPHPESAAAVTGVKIYRVEFHNPPVKHFEAGRDPLDPTLYAPFYQGDFEPDGRLKPSCLRILRDPSGREVVSVQDPFLYWLIPIVRVPEGAEPPRAVPPTARLDPRRSGPWSGEGRVVNYVNIHAGDKDKEDLP
jgi:hypothetical protein